MNVAPKYMVTTPSHTPYHVKNLLNDPKCVKPLLEYIALSHRLETVSGDVTPPKDKDAE